MTNIDSFIVYDCNYQIDFVASVHAFESYLSEYESRSEGERQTIGEALHALFDKHTGKRLAAPYVVAECLRWLNAQPENYQHLTDKVKEFLSNSSTFDVKKGKGGGWARSIDSME